MNANERKIQEEDKKAARKKYKNIETERGLRLKYEKYERAVNFC